MASAPLLPPPELDLFGTRGRGAAEVEMFLGVDAALALVDLVTLGSTPLVGGVGIFADVDLFRTPPDELPHKCFREEEDDDDVDEEEEEGKRVEAREADAPELGPAPLASAFTLRYLFRERERESEFSGNPHKCINNGFNRQGTHCIA